MPSVEVIIRAAIWMKVQPMGRAKEAREEFTRTSHAPRGKNKNNPLSRQTEAAFERGVALFPRRRFALNIFRRGAPARGLRPAFFVAITTRRASAPVHQLKHASTSQISSCF